MRRIDPRHVADGPAGEDGEAARALPAPAIPAGPENIHRIAAIGRSDGREGREIPATRSYPGVGPSLPPRAAIKREFVSISPTFARNRLTCRRGGRCNAMKSRRLIAPPTARHPCVHVHPTRLHPPQRRARLHLGIGHRAHGPARLRVRRPALAGRTRHPERAPRNHPPPREVRRRNPVPSLRFTAIIRATE